MKRRPKPSNSMDIVDALSGWRFETGEVNVRLVPGKDGKPKLQMRLDLGLLQMEMDGRPDGRRPHQSRTELDFQLRRLKGHQRRFGTPDGFALSGRDCQALREESAMFYHRYLSLFVLEHYDEVVRDTQHNINVLDMCNKYGRTERDRYVLEQYRPYIIMMQGRARACQALQAGYAHTSLAYLRGALRSIARFFNAIPHMDRDQRKALFRHCDEARILNDMIVQIKRQLPPDPLKMIQKRLHRAVREEQFEQAAELRDQLSALRATHGGHKRRAKRGRSPIAATGDPRTRGKRPAERRARRRDGKSDEM